MNPRHVKGKVQLYHYTGNRNGHFTTPKCRSISGLEANWKVSGNSEAEEVPVDYNCDYSFDFIGTVTILVQYIAGKGCVKLGTRCCV